MSRLWRWFCKRVLGRRDRLEELILRPVAATEVYCQLLPSDTPQAFLAMEAAIDRKRGFLLANVPKGQYCNFMIVPFLPRTHCFFHIGSATSEVLLQSGPDALEQFVMDGVFRSIEKAADKKAIGEAE